MGVPSGALQLRLLQTVSDVASDRTNTVIMPLPLEMLRFFSQAAGAEPQVSAPDEAVPLPPPPPADAREPVPEHARTDGDGAAR
jgi:hypothetical protein